MEKHLFITDFDGTLLNDDKRISPRDLTTLAQLRKTGTATAIATGRSYFSFFRALDQMGMDRKDLPVDYLIFSTGAGILELATDEVIRKHSLDRDAVAEVCACFDGYGFEYTIHRAIPRTEEFLYKGGENWGADFSNRVKMYADFGRPLEGAASLFPAATEVLAVIQDGLDAEGVARVQADLSQFSVIHATSPLDHRSSWIEVFHPRVSKSLSTAWLIREIGVAQDRVISVGNDYNDVDLLEWSGQGFMVENGPDDLKAVFPVVTSNNDSGVSRAAERAGLI